MIYYAVYVTDEPNKGPRYCWRTNERKEWAPYYMHDNNRASGEGPRLFVERKSAERSAHYFRTQRDMTCEVHAMSLKPAVVAR